MAQLTFVEWLQMGGYAAYVWPAFGIVIGTLMVFYRRARQALRDTKRRLMLVSDR